jgi:hypothetical protein
MVSENVADRADTYGETDRPPVAGDASIADAGDRRGALDVAMPPGSFRGPKGIRTPDLLAASHPA